MQVLILNVLKNNTMNTKEELQNFSKSKGMKWPVECHFYNWEYMIEFAELYAAKVKNLNLHDVSINEGLESCEGENINEVREQCAMHGVMPCFCFICGTKLIEVGLGWLQCESEQCGEVYLPFIDENNNQCLMHQRTPFSPK